MASSNPSDAKMRVWAIPEPIVHESLSSLPLKEDGQSYAFEIFPEEQRIKHFDASPDLSPFSKELWLSQQEMAVLHASREADKFKKESAKQTRAGQPPDAKRKKRGSAPKDRPAKLLAKKAKQLTDEGVFDLSEISDARERTLSAIVRRRGQPAFRRRVLAAYNGRCAITRCPLDYVLDAAHIVPYKGPKTHHVGNGLLLRTDLHTLFDLQIDRDRR